MDFLLISLGLFSDSSKISHITLGKFLFKHSLLRKFFFPSFIIRRELFLIFSHAQVNIYVTHSQSVDGGAKPSILAEFGKGSVVRAINWHSRALGSRSQRRGAGTNNNDLWQQSAHTVKETKSLLVVASGLTRLRCLVRV